MRSRLPWMPTYFQTGLFTICSQERMTSILHAPATGLNLVSLVVRACIFPSALLGSQAGLRTA